MLYTKGRLALWKATYEPSRKLLNGNNKASQDFDPTRRSALNKAEYFGGQLYVTASGTYQPADASAETPKLVNVSITSGSLHVLGADIPLPIRGKGVFEICYLDESLRIFRSAGSYAVQVRQDKLAGMLAK